MENNLEDFRRMDGDPVRLLKEPKFRKNLSPPSSGWKEECSLIRSTQMMKPIISSKTLVLTTASRRSIAEGGKPRSQRLEDLKSYMDNSFVFLVLS
jgi:hypothetical protein